MAEMAGDAIHCPKESMMVKKPNILYFVADQMRADAQHYLGNEMAQTPHLDALASDGVAFRNAYCQNPVCVPSRCSFLSGLYPHTTGHRTMHYLQREDEPNLLRTMKQAGYEVIWIGRNDVIPGDHAKTAYCDEYYNGIVPGNTRDKTYDVMRALQHTRHEEKDPVPFNKDEYSFYIGKVSPEQSGAADVGCVNACLDYLDRKKESGDERPFFVYCTLMYPHPPYACCDPWYSQIKRDDSLWPRKKWVPDKPKMLRETADIMDLHHWSKERWTELRATYLAMVAKWDSQLGQVVDKLKENGFYDDTSIFCFSDHGDYTGDYDIVEKLQNCFENDLTNIPLVIKPAKQFACQPRITDALAELVDLNATVAEMTGTTLDYVQYGKSLVHVLAGDDTHKDAVFSEGGRPQGDIYAKELGHDSPQDVYYPRLHVQHQDDGAHGRAVMIRMGNIKYTKRYEEKDELYDLDLDPNEMVNRIDDPAYTDIIEKMKLRMLEWYQETADWIPNRKDMR